VTRSNEEIIVAHNWDELRRFMWAYVGIVRKDERLQRAKRRISLLAQETNDYYKHYIVSKDLLELRNLVQVASLIVECAIARKESRGLHYTTDYPDLLPEALDTILTPNNAIKSCD
jgi:L-aspartate oxidase